MIRRNYLSLILIGVLFSYVILFENNSTMGDKKGETGSAGAIRAAGGAFAKMEQAHEEEYFFKLVKFYQLC